MCRFAPVLRLPFRQRSGLWLRVLGVVIPWGIFLKASSEIEENEGFLGDDQVLRWVHGRATPALDTLNLWISHVGGPLPMSGVSLCIGGWLLWRRRHREARFLGAAVGGAALLNLLAKWVLGRPRPAFWGSLAPETSSSFPSGHAMGSAAWVLALGLLLARWRGHWLAWGGGALFAAGVGFSRVYLGVHYPSDVLAGWVASVGWVTGLYLVLPPNSSRRNDQSPLLPNQNQ